VSCLDIFSHDKPIIGVIHLLPLPGSPRYSGNIDSIFERAEWEAEKLLVSGLDGLIIENYNDDPLKRGEPAAEQLAVMAAIIASIHRRASIPLGVNVHFNAWRAEIALAFACRAQFARIEIFVDTVVSASGLAEPCAAAVTRYRREIGASGIALWADLHAKFTRNLVPTNLAESARMAKSSLPDALIVTGPSTGIPTSIEDIRTVKEIVDLPVLAGSGMTVENIQSFLGEADGAIVGSAFKEGGDAHNRVSPEAVGSFLKSVRA
jgi:membrane complex biogenesis BtpA family protein